MAPVPRNITEEREIDPVGGDDRHHAPRITIAT